MLVKTNATEASTMPQPPHFAMQTENTRSAMKAARLNPEKHQIVLSKSEG
jgi:hypothetical protein